MTQPNGGKNLGYHKIDPSKIKLADDQITSDKPFRNPRTHLNAEEMAHKRESIRTLGVLKPPIVRPLANDPEYSHQMIAGSLRLRCVLKLRDENPECYNSELGVWQPAQVVYATLNCQVHECDEETAIRISIAENLEHTQVPELDLMEYCQELVELKTAKGEARYTREQVAKLCNRSESWVSLTLQLNELEPAYKKLMQDGRLSRTGAIAMVLGTTKENFSTIIEKCNEEVRQEAEAEEEEAEEEEKVALQDLEDAEIDMGIHETAKNIAAAESAKKRYRSAQKRVSVASDKRKAAVKKAETGAITADTVNKVIMKTPGAKKGKAKRLSDKVLKELHTNYSSFAAVAEGVTVEDRLAANIATAVIEIALGKRTTETDISSLITAERQKLLQPPDCLTPTIVCEE